MYAIGLWLRFFLYRLLPQLPAWTRWKGNKVVADSIRRPLLDWFLLLGAFIAVQSSVLNPQYKSLANQIIATLFFISLAFVSVIVTEKLIRLYSTDAKMNKRQISISLNVVRITLFVIFALIILSVWGARLILFC
jgi:small-conductance mechanosensitive channel